MRGEVRRGARPPSSRKRAAAPGITPRELLRGAMIEAEQTTPPLRGHVRADFARLLLTRPDSRLPTYFRRWQRRSFEYGRGVALYDRGAFFHAQQCCRCALDAWATSASSLYSLLARDHFVPRALAASVDSWEEFSANELLRRQRRFRAVAHLRGRRKRSGFATWALVASLASFERESRLVLRRRLLAEAFSILRTVRTGPCTPRSASRMAAYSTV